MDNFKNFHVDGKSMTRREFYFYLCEKKQFKDKRDIPVQCEAGTGHGFYMDDKGVLFAIV